MRDGKPHEATRISARVDGRSTTRGQLPQLRAHTTANSTILGEALESLLPVSACSPRPVQGKLAVSELLEDFWFPEYLAVPQKRRPEDRERLASPSVIDEKSCVEIPARGTKSVPVPGRCQLTETKARPIPLAVAMKLDRRAIVLDDPRGQETTNVLPTRLEHATTKRFGLDSQELRELRTERTPHRHSRKQRPERGRPDPLLEPADSKKGLCRKWKVCKSAQEARWGPARDDRHRDTILDSRGPFVRHEKRQAFTKPRRNSRVARSAAEPRGQQTVRDLVNDHGVDFSRHGQVAVCGNRHDDAGILDEGLAGVKDTRTSGPLS